MKLFYDTICTVAIFVLCAIYSGANFEVGRFLRTFRILIN